MHQTPFQYGLLKVEGQQAGSFLQGQLTNDIEKMVNNKGYLAAHCHPQGRVISLFTIYRIANDYLLLMPSNLVPLTISALKKYAVFYKIALSDASHEINHYQTLLPDLAQLHANQFEAGIPTLYPETSHRFLPHELNLIALKAVSLDKGCYTGQEIIARMHYKGKLKNHLYKATLNTPIRPKAGANIINEAQHVCGNVVDTHNDNDDYQLLIILEQTQAQTATLHIQDDPQHKMIVES